MQKEKGGTFLPLDAHIVCSAAVVGKKEHDGPLGEYFDMFDESGEDKFGRKTWEMAESEMQRTALNLALVKGHLKETDIGALFAGDLLNQCVGAAYGLMNFPSAYFGLYGACSTFAEGMILGAICAAHGAFERCAVVASSHFCAAERQYRTPVEYGGQRPPTAQWTVTGAGAAVIARGAGEVTIAGVLPGTVVEMGIKDVGNMGAAMAPAALDTLLRYFRATDTRPEDFDLIMTGDLGHEGGAILSDLLGVEGYAPGAVLNDGGMMIYNRETQDTHAGGSGCGCSAAVMSSYVIPRLESGALRRVLFLGTGAMMSPDSLKQGQSIPAVAHLVELRHGGIRTADIKMHKMQEI